LPAVQEREDRLLQGHLERLRLGGRRPEAEGRPRHPVGPEPLGPTAHTTRPTASAQTGASSRIESIRRNALAGASAFGRMADAASCPNGHRTHAMPPKRNARGNSKDLMPSAVTANVTTRMAVIPATGPSYGLLDPEPTR